MFPWASVRAGVRMFPWASVRAGVRTVVWLCIQRVFCRRQVVEFPLRHTTPRRLSNVIRELRSAVITQISEWDLQLRQPLLQELVWCIWCYLFIFQWTYLIAQVCTAHCSWDVSKLVASSMKWLNAWLHLLSGPLPLEGIFVFVEGWQIESSNSFLQCLVNLDFASALSLASPTSGCWTPAPLSS